MKYFLSLLLVVIICTFLPVIVAPATGATTDVHIVLLAADGYTVLNETTVDYRWMEANLPVMGDGVTQYYHQGPVFLDDPDEETEQALRWNPEEDNNVEMKGMGALKGTKVEDLCDLVGGMAPDEEIKIISSDGWNKRFAYKNVYEYSSREGPMVLAWYNGAETPGTWERQGVGYVPNYYSGIRLVWFADTSVNPQGIHAFGNWDWHEAADSEYWYYYYGSPTEKYPTTTGLSGKYVSEIQILSNREPEGSIDVTSNPAGARIYLDGVDTGSDTPCTLEALSEGFYSLTVQKAGYLTPDEQFVEVIAGKSMPVRFDLEPVSQGGGDAGPGSGGDTGLSTGTELDILSGGQLSGTEYLHLKGSLLLYSTSTSPFIFRGGEEHVVAFSIPLPPASPALLRLYLFLGKCSADPGIDADPDILISTTTGEIPPVRTWSEPEGDGDRSYATTLVYTLPPGNENGTFILRSRNHPSWNSTVAGALLVAGYEESGARETGAWIYEGADSIGNIPGLESPLTLVEFSDTFPAEELVNATLFTATTPSSASGNLSFLINGVSIPGQPVSGGGPVAVHEIAIADLPDRAAFRLHIGTKGPVVSNRVAILTVTLPQHPVGFLAETAPPVPTQTIETPLTIPGTIEGETTTGEVLPGGGQEGVGADPIGAFLCWLHNLVLRLGGQPSEACYQRTIPAGTPNETVIPTPEIPGSRGAPLMVSVSSSPAGATVFLDDEPTGKITPCEIEVAADGMYSIRLVKGGYQPFEQQITGPEGIEAVLLPESPLPESTMTSAAAAARSHHGGVFIHTYPEQAEIRVDGVVVGTSSPILIYPLKEGFHTIMAGIRTGENAYSSKETIRTWVFPDAIMPVEFNLMDATASAFVTISGESRTGTPFTVNGYYPVKRIPEKVELIDYPSFITLTNRSSYLSFTISPSSRETREFSVPATDPALFNLSVESDPEGAEIFIDGIRTTLQTPAVVPNVSVGYHRISLTARDRIPVTHLVYIAESQITDGEYHVRYPLSWYASGSLNLTSNPPGAAVSVRGLKTGEVTPCTLNGIPIGVWEVTLTSGKEKRSLDATVEPAKTTKYSVRFH